jgi:putative protease
VLNEKARAFYQRHGVVEIQPAAESGLDMRGRKVMTTKHCIKHQLGYCARFKLSNSSQPPRLQEPLALIDEQGKTYPLRFDCARCEMDIYFLETAER